MSNVHAPLESLARIDELTGAYRGPKYLSALVLCLTRALGVRYALIAERSSLRDDEVRTLAFADGEDERQPFVYQVTQLPCGTVLKGSSIAVPCEIAKQYPEASDIDAYCGQPLRDTEGHVIGLLAVEHTAPIADAEGIVRLLGRLAGRVSAELECERLRRRGSDGQAAAGALS